MRGVTVRYKHNLSDTPADQVHKDGARKDVHSAKSIDCICAAIRMLPVPSGGAVRPAGALRLEGAAAVPGPAHAAPVLKRCTQRDRRASPLSPRLAADERGNPQQCRTCASSAPTEQRMEKAVPQASGAARPGGSAVRRTCGSKCRLRDVGVVDTHTHGH